MKSTEWGRKETIIWPPHSPIYTYGAVFLAFIMTGMFLYLRFSFGQTPLQQFYTPIYARTAAGAAFKKKNKYQLLYLAEASRTSRLAAESDVTEGQTPQPGGKIPPLALSARAASQGLTALYRGPEQVYLDAPLHEYLRLPKSRSTRPLTALSSNRSSIAPIGTRHFPRRSPYRSPR